MKEIRSAEQTSAGEVSVGTTFVQRARVLGRPMEVPTVVTIFEPLARFGYQADEGPLPYEAIYAFSRRADVTLLAADVTLRPRGVAWLLAPLAGRLVRTAYRRNLERMRELLEAGGWTASAKPASDAHA